MADAIGISSVDMGGLISSVDTDALQVLAGELSITAIDLSLALGSSYDGSTLRINPSTHKLEINPATGALGTGIDLGKAIASTVGTALAVNSGVLGVPANAITASLIAANAVDDTKFDRVTVNKIAIVSADIVNLTAAKITAGTLAAGVILSSSIAATQILAGTLAAGVVYAGSVVVSQLTAGTATFSGNVSFIRGSSAINITSTAITLDFAGVTCQVTSGQVALVSGSFSCTVTASALTLSSGSNSCTITSSSLTLASSSSQVVITSSSLALTVSGLTVVSIASSGQTTFSSGGSQNTLITGGAIQTNTVTTSGTTPSVSIGTGGVLNIQGAQVMKNRQAGPGHTASTYVSGGPLANFGDVVNYLNDFYNAFSAAAGGHGSIN